MKIPFAFMGPGSASSPPTDFASFFTTNWKHFWSSYADSTPGPAGYTDTVGGFNLPNVYGGAGGAPPEATINGHVGPVFDGGYTTQGLTASGVNFDTLDGAANWTIIAAVKTNNKQAYGAIIDKAGTFYIEMAFGPGALAITIGNGGGADITGTIPINDNNWHRIIITCIAGTVYVYVDGVLDGTDTGGTIPAGIINDLLIGVQLNTSVSDIAIAFVGIATAGVAAPSIATLDGLIDDYLGNPVTGVDPSTLSLTFWLEDFAGAAEAPDPGPGPWVSKASAGLSGTENRRAIDMNIPAATVAIGPALDGHESAYFAGTGDCRGQDDNGAMRWDGIFGATISDWYAGALVRFITFPPAAGAGNWANEAHIIGDDGGNGVFAFADDGVKAYSWDYGGTNAYYATPTQLLNAGTVYWVEATYTGGVLSLYVNGTLVGSTSAITDMSPNTASFFLLGRGYSVGQPTRPDAELYCLMTAAQAFDGPTRAGLKAYINTRFGLAL